jgi:hypothetical protein
VFGLAALHPLHFCLARRVRFVGCELVASPAYSDTVFERSGVWVWVVGWPGIVVGLKISSGYF